MKLTWEDTDCGYGWRPTFDAQIQILKAAHLVKKIDMVAITNEGIKSAIEPLSKERNNELCGFTNIYNLTACDWRMGPGYDKISYCGETRLSFPATGIKYLALHVDADTVPDLTPDLLQHWIDFCSMFFDVENYNPTGPTEMNARTYMTSCRATTIAKHVTKNGGLSLRCKQVVNLCFMTKGLA